MLPSYCDGVDRRGFLKVGSLGGLTLAQAMRLQSLRAAEPIAASHKDVNCIFIFIIGGMAHQDMWDLKPDAPAEIRGDFTPISTCVPGMQVSNILPHMAGVADQFAILRGLTHTDPDHTAGYHVMMTGAHPGTGGNFNRNKQDNNVHPSLGSMVAKVGGGNGSLPPYISVPNFLNSGGPAFLGASYAPFVIESDPASPEFAVRDIVLPEGVASDRSVRRQSALREVNRFEREVERASKTIQAVDVFQEKAYNLMTSQRAKEAFDIGRERDETRSLYGMTSLGQCCLLGRRLVEAGCRFVSIENGHWDTHRKNTMSLRDLLVPALDQGVAALLADLKQRGMLDSTLVVVTTEFGRTPRINTMAGRDHWPQAFSIVMAGAGIRGGNVIGATDSQAAYVTDRPVTPPDMAATVLKFLGIDPEIVVQTPVGRPVQLASGGRAVHELV
ncbi:MAG: DUF1501 domain-containing protein [Planctomycetaceae bacterium]|nr:MAG: DUF1501 domain-containing protein [Planctomycetaceae bacterium]